MEKNCEECHSMLATLYCEDCEQLFCEPCNSKIHKNGKRKEHIRTEIPNPATQDFPVVSDPSLGKSFENPGYLKPCGWEGLYRKSQDNRWVHFNQGSADKETYKILKRKAALSENYLDKGLKSVMKKLAYQGKITHEFKELREQLAHRLQISHDSSFDLIKSAIRSGVLVQQLKRVADLDFNLVSLKVEKMTVKVLLWVLRSLKSDEMIPTEKAIQSRIKESFDLKISPGSWSSFLDFALKSRKIHKKACSERVDFSLFSQSGDSKLKNLCFQMKTIWDFGTNTENTVVYPVNEEWVSYDQHIKSGDVFHLKNSQEWQSFILFFESRFESRCCEDNAISGGRYGCAQFLKKSSAALSKFSLGKLSYMIQLAIDEDLLRYHKTLLVYVPAFDKKCKEDKKSIFLAKQFIVEALSACPEGISLAQLPTLLKEKHPFDFDLSSLGFAKLKDLINEIPDIELSFKGKNHPFVRVVKKGTPTIEAVFALILAKLEQNKGKMSLIDCDLEIANFFGYGLKWTSLKFRNTEELLKSFGQIVVTDGKYVEKKESFEKNHSYNSSSTSEAYPVQASLENDDPENKLDDIEDQQKKFIEGLLEDEI